MTTLRLAWRNLWRNVKRTLLMIAIVAVGTWAIVVFWGLTEGFLATTVNSQKNINAGDLQIHKSGYLEDPSLKNTLSADQLDTVEETLSKLKLIEGFSPRLELEGLLRSAYGSMGVRIRGINPHLETKVTTFNEAVVEGSFIESPGQIILSKQMARNLDVRIGERVVIDVQGKQGPKALAFLVAGLFDTSLPSLNQSMVYIYLQDAKALGGTGGVSEIAIALSSGSNSNQVAGELKKRLGGEFKVSTFMDLNPLLRSMMVIERIEMIPLMIMLAVLAGFGVANTVMFTVLERTREFGVMIALGMKPKKLARMVISESILSSMFGFALGGGVGYLLNYWLSQVGIDFGAFTTITSKFGMPTTVYAQSSGWYWVYSLSVVVITGIIAAWYPARRTIKIEPTEAMRHV